MSSSPITAEPAPPRIVKAHAVDAIGTPLAFNYQDLKRACEEHLSAVREQSRRLISESSAEIEALRKQALEEGRKQGYQAGLKAAEADVAARVERLAAEKLASQLETVLPAIRHLADRLGHDRERWIARWDGDAVRLAIAVAEKLIRRTLSADPSAADALLAETLRMASGSPQVVVRMSPIDLERLGGSIAAITESVERLGEVTVISDPEIGAGDCVVDTRNGRVDGRLGTMLDRIASELIGVDENAEEATFSQATSHIGGGEQT